MKIKGQLVRSLAPVAGELAIDIIDQTALPHDYRLLRLRSLEAAAHAIRVMQVRGAPLIGVTAAYGLAMALHQDASDGALNEAVTQLGATRPTAVNLHWALARMQSLLIPLPIAQRATAAWLEATRIAEEDAEQCRCIGEHGLNHLHALPRKTSRLNLMTHCNAGWLATCGAGTALAPIYAAQAAGIAVEVFVSETRPRNQGLLTAWELRAAGVPHVLIADNAAGLLLMRGEVDMVITGADRIAANGDSANKVGTYLKALAAQAAGVPFYIAAPHSTLDFACADGAAIPIEDRGAAEVCHVRGLTPAGDIAELALAPTETRAVNPAFDVTPAALIRGIITERGIAPAGELARLYPEHER